MKRGVVKRKQKENDDRSLEGRTNIILKKNKKSKMIKPNKIDKSKGMTSEEIDEKLNSMSLGQVDSKPKTECLICQKKFTKVIADKKNKEQWWRYSYCSFKCFSEMLAEVREKLKVRYGEYEVPDIAQHYKIKKIRKVIKRKKHKRKIIKRKKHKRKIIKRRGNQCVQKQEM